MLGRQAVICGQSIDTISYILDRAVAIGREGER